MALPDQIKVCYSEGYDYGIGVNYATGGPKNKAVTGAVSTVEDAEGSTVRFQVRRITTTSELEQALDISASASYGAAAFGAGAEARFGFAQSAKIQSSSLVMLITATIKRAFEQIDEPALTPPASAVAANPTVFAERYGNMFVRGVTSGGLFVGYMRIDTGSTEISNKVSFELSGSYGLFSAEAKAKFEEIQKTYHSDLTVDMYHEGGPVDLHVNKVEDPLELLRCVNEFLGSFATQPGKVAVAYSVTFAPLTIANGPLPPNEIDLQHAQDVLIFCAKRRSVLTDQLNTYQYITDFPERFDPSNGADFIEIGHAAENAQLDLGLIAKCASYAMNNPISATLPETFATGVGDTYPKLDPPDKLPIPIPIKPAKPEPNAMPDLVGRLADPVTDLFACVNLERAQADAVDHCLSFTQAEARIGPEARALAEFFRLTTTAGTTYDVNDPSGSGSTIKAQFPPVGVAVTPGATVRIDIG